MCGGSGETGRGEWSGIGPDRGNTISKGPGMQRGLDLFQALEKKKASKAIV